MRSLDFVLAVGSGDRRVALEGLRDELAEAIVVCRPGELAALAKQLSDVLRQLEGLGGVGGEKGTALNELERRRAERRSNTG